MGIFDNISAALASSGAKGGFPLKITFAFRPVRLASRRDDSVELLLTIENVGEKPALASVSIVSPKGLAFESMGLGREKELRLGSLEVGDRKTLSVPIHGSSRTPPGNYRVEIDVCHHYRDYGHVISTVKKIAELRVV
jgi:uncharacterized membrane protein